MDPAARDYCLKSMAYLKVMEPADAADTPSSLSQCDSPVLRPIGHQLIVAYLVDEGECFSYVQHRHIEGAGLSPDELHAQAIANLAAFARERIEVKSYGNHLYYVLMGGNFEASLILVNEFWSEWCAQLAPTGFLAAFPARDVLAFGDASSPEALSGLEAICDRCKEGGGDHTLTFNVFRRAGVSWEPIGG